MKFFNRLNPVPVFLYFVSAAVVCTVMTNPYFTAVSFISSLIMFFMIRGNMKVFGGFLLIAFAAAVINPVLSKQGETILIFIGSSPVTLESVLYGVNSAFTVLAVLLWSYSFSRLLTSRKLLYLMAPLSPTAALTVSMVLRFAPRYAEQAKLISDQQTALGEKGGGSIPEKTKFALKVFSALTAIALEGGVVTSDSMAARGYGVGRRRFYSEFRFSYTDAAMTAAVCALAAAVTVLSILCKCSGTFYPLFSMPETAPSYIICCILFTVLVLLPVAAEITDGLKWKYLMRKI